MRSNELINYRGNNIEELFKEQKRKKKISLIHYVLVNVESNDSLRFCFCFIGQFAHIKLIFIIQYTQYFYSSVVSPEKI